MAEKTFKANCSKKKAKVAIFISDKIDFKIKINTRSKKKSLYNDKGVNSSVRQSNLFLCNFFYYSNEFITSVVV